jgi:hypothetical protein
MQSELIDERRFPGARRAGDTDEMGLACVLKEICERSPAFRRIVLHLSEKTRKCETISF